MGETVKPPVSDSTNGLPHIRTIGNGVPWRWLAAGWGDLRGGGGASLFYGVCFAAAGWLMQRVFQHDYALFAGLATGFLLLGPFLALGLYDISRHLACLPGPGQTGLSPP